MTENHNTYLVLLKDRNPDNVEESTTNAAKSIVGLLQEQKLTEQVSGVDAFAGVILLKCTSTVADAVKSLTNIVEEVAQANSADEIQEYILTKTFSPEQQEQARKQIEKRASHKTYFVLLKDRTGDVDEKTVKGKDVIKEQLIAKNLWNESEISEFEVHFAFGLIAIQCTDEVIELIKAQTALVEDATRIETAEQSMEYMLTKAMSQEDAARFLNDINDPSF